MFETDSDQPEKEPSAAKQALELAKMRLGVREYAAGEMKSYLRRKKFEPREIEEAVNELVEKGLISDGRYSKIIARHSAQRGKGPGYIRSKLMQKGVKVDPATAKKLYDENSTESELELGRRILEARYPKAHENMKEKQKAYQGLIRRGISHDVARLCFKKIEQD
jgi:SOS response regulatory protein OraA/RecX